MFNSLLCRELLHPYSGLEAESAVFHCLSKKYSINAVVLGHWKRIEGFVAACVCLHRQSQCTCVLCDVLA